jgi:gamma-tubulin complex component 2
MMRKTSTAAANRAALARRRQRIAAETTTTTPTSSSSEEQLGLSPSVEPKQQRPPLATSLATSLGEKTPTTSNLDSSSSEQRIPLSISKSKVGKSPYHSLQADRLERASLVENQYITNNPQVSLSHIRSRKVTKSSTTPFQEAQPRPFLSDPPPLLAEKENETADVMPAATQEDYVEDPERIIDSDDEIVDATVLMHHSSITIKTISDATKTIKLEEHDTKWLAQLTGTGLAGPDETIEIHHKSKVPTSKSDTVIRYGEPVVFYSRTAKAYLGVRTKGNIDPTTTNGVTFELGFFRKAVSEVETWTILHGDRKLLVGSAARTVKAPSRTTEAVRSGHALVLRNNFIGGLLSVQRNDATQQMELSLVTQSYDSNAETLEPLIDRALHHYEMYPSKSELFHFWHSHTPPCPNWTYSKKEESASKGHDNTNAKKWTPLEQEKLLLDEVIGSLMGLEGNFIRRERGVFYLRQKPPIHSSLGNLVKRIIPISNGYTKITSFLRQHQPGYDYGLVMQALCQEIDEILGDHLLTVEILEKKYRGGDGVKLTLNRAFVEIQTLASPITLLEHVILCAQDKIGGSLLNSMWDLKMTSIAGDVRKQALLKKLIDRASVPWMNMLDSWLKSGELRDLCGEFMVQRNKSKKINGDNWDTLFSLNHESVFKGAIASRLLQEKVLTTGKYWNAVHHCDYISASAFPDAEEVDGKILRYSGDPSTLATYIEQTYQNASSYLVQLLLGQFRIESTLTTLKRYFLLDQGDFLVHFMDTAQPELTKLVDDVSQGRTQHWLNMALQLTDATEDVPETTSSLRHPVQPLKPRSIRCFFADESLDVMLGVREGEPKTPSRHPYGQVAGLTGMLAFTLDFPQVPFPTSLILSKQNLSSYQMLFRHIFYAKHIEQRLVGVWLDNQMMKEFHSVRGLLGPTFCLRQRMLHFIHNFIYYMMLEVIEPNWARMMEDVPKQETADDLIALHRNCLKTIMEDCLLTHAALFKSLAKIMSTCLTFSEQMRRFMETTGVSKDKKRRQGSASQRPTGKRGDRQKAMRAEREEREARQRKQAGIIERELKNETYKRMIKRHEEVFQDNLDDFMGKLKSSFDHHAQITNLCIRLDYNGFISGKSNNR